MISYLGFAALTVLNIRNIGFYEYFAWRQLLTERASHWILSHRSSLFLHLLLKIIKFALVVHETSYHLFHILLKLLQLLFLLTRAIVIIYVGHFCLRSVNHPLSCVGFFSHGWCRRCLALFLGILPFRRFKQFRSRL